MRGMLGQQNWERLTRSWWEKQILENSRDPQGMFSRARFLGQLRKVKDGQLAELLGPQATAEFNDLRDVLQAQERIGQGRLKESGTGQTVLMHAQLAGLGASTALLGHGLYVGNKDQIGTGAGGLLTATLTPATLAFLLSNPTGIRILSGVVRNMPSPRTAVARLGLYLGQKGFSAHPPADVSSFFQPEEVSSAKLPR